MAGINLQKALDEVGKMSQEELRALMEKVLRESGIPYQSAGNEKVMPQNEEEIYADTGNDRRFGELQVKPCGNGAHFTAAMDNEDGSIIIFGDGGWAMGYIEYPWGTAKWIVTDECKPGVQRYWTTCSKCGRKRAFLNYIDEQMLQQEYPLCECGAKIMGVEERFEFE